MASGLVKRVVDKGDIFLVVESTVYVANVSWNGIWQEVRKEEQLFFVGGREGLFKRVDRVSSIGTQIMRCC